MQIPRYFMKSSPSISSFSILFLLIAILELVSEALFADIPELHYVAKPLVLITLSLYYFRWTTGERSSHTYLMQVALFFSIMGDSFLMFDDPMYFLMGLGSFMITQCCYIFVFRYRDTPPVEKSLLTRNPWIAIPFIAYMVLFVWLIYSGLGEMTAPVIVYSLVILGMVLMALNRWKQVLDDSFAWVFAGALLFMLSDSMIALDRFAKDLFPIPLAKYWIMITYMGAQYLIVLGMLKQVLGKRRF